MHDARVDPVRPVVEQDLVVVLELKRVAPGFDGCLPVQSVAQDEVHHAAVLLPEAPVVLQVAAQVGGDALEELQPVGGYYGPDFGPRLQPVGAVGLADYAEVLGVEVLQELGAFRGAEGGRHVDVPVGRRRLGGRAAHGLVIYVPRGGGGGVVIVVVS